MPRLLYINNGKLIDTYITVQNNVRLYFNDYRHLFLCRHSSRKFKVSTKVFTTHTNATVFYIK